MNLWLKLIVHFVRINAHRHSRFDPNQISEFSDRRPSHTHFNSLFFVEIVAVS
jgi:hypothetical protein